MSTGRRDSRHPSTSIVQVVYARERLDGPGARASRGSHPLRTPLPPAQFLSPAEERQVFLEPEERGPGIRLELAILNGAPAPAGPAHPAGRGYAGAGVTVLAEVRMAAGGSRSRMGLVAKNDALGHDERPTHVRNVFVPVRPGWRRSMSRPSAGSPGPTAPSPPRTGERQSSFGARSTTTPGAMSWPSGNMPRTAGINLELGLKAKDPRFVVTTTPRPIPLIKQLLADPGTVVTRG